MTTQDDLKDAFAGESQANRKYLAYAEQAERDGKPQVARLFRAVAAAETLHAHAHLRAMDGVKSTEVNLADALSGEEYEFTTMYPPMVARAKAEGHKKAERSMSQALEVEKVHHVLFKAALDAVRAGRDLPADALRICPVCGHTVIGEAPASCPVCGVKGEKYTEIG
ncbi:MAG: rubrerythrin family protein [Rhodospirillales bacterium]|nr:rubrerythrin family protein [Rhodospirillales bacterium]